MNQNLSRWIQPSALLTWVARWFYVLGLGKFMSEKHYYVRTSAFRLQISLMVTYEYGNCLCFLHFVGKNYQRLTLLKDDQIHLQTRYR